MNPPRIERIERIERKIIPPRIEHIERIERTFQSVVNGSQFCGFESKTPPDQRLLLPECGFNSLWNSSDEVNTPQQKAMVCRENDYQLNKRQRTNNLPGIPLQQPASLQK